MVLTSLSSLHEPTAQNKLDLGIVEVLPQAVLLVGAESPAHLHQIPPAHLEVLMTLLVQIALTQLAQKMSYQPVDLPLVLYLLSQLNTHPSLVTSQPWLLAVYVPS
jgi:hypothetical protein